MAEVLLIQSGWDLVSIAASTTYDRACAGHNMGRENTEAQSAIKSQIAGVYRQLACYISTNDRGASTLAFRDNLGAGSQSVSIGASSTGEFEDTSGSDTMAADEYVATVLTVGAGGTTFTLEYISMLFAATTNTVKIFCPSNVIYNVSSVTRYNSLVGLSSNALTAEDETSTKMKTAGTLKKLYVYVNLNARTSDSTVITRKNTADGNITVTIGAGLTGEFADDSNTDTIAVDDLVAMAVTTGTSSGTKNLQIRTQSIAFETTDDSNVFIANASDTVTVAASAVTYCTIEGRLITGAEQALTTNLAFTISKLECYISANTITNASTLVNRKSGGDGACSVSITGSTTGWFEDASNSDTYAASDTIAIKITGGSSGTSLTLKTVSCKVVPVATVPLTVAVADTLALSDAIQIAIGLLAEFADALVLSDELTNINLGLLSAFADALVLDDDKALLFGYLSAIADTLDITDDLSPSLGTNLSFADLLALDDETVINLADFVPTTFAEHQKMNIVRPFHIGM